jgi:nucleoside triphosphatase
MENIPISAVGVLIFNSKGEIFLVKSPKWDNKYIVPGGKVNFRETLKEAVRREVKEETGLEVYDIRFLCVFDFINPLDFHKSGKHFVGIQFICRTNKTNVKLNQEGLDYVWIKPQEALKKLKIQKKTEEAIRIFLRKQIYKL